MSVAATRKLPNRPQRLCRAGPAVLFLAAGCVSDTGTAAPEVQDPRSSVALEACVRMLAEQDPPRSAAHPEVLRELAGTIAAELRAAGAEVELQDFEVDGRDYVNVRAFLGPPTPERLVVGAHYDVAGELPGADDNASGVAVLLSLGHLLGGAELETRVELVAYSLEEPPYFATENMGSAVHARELRAEGVDVLGMISLEMVGYFDDEEGSQDYPVEELRAIYPPAGDFITIVGREEDADLSEWMLTAMSAAAELPVERLLAPVSVPGIDWSDHRNYWAEGYPAVMITDTSFYRNPNYHTERDTPETLDYERMALVLEGVFAAVLELAGGTS